MAKKKYFYLGLFSLFMLLSCKHNSAKSTSGIPTPMGNTIFADTIIYDVIIKNTNPLDHWTNDCLKKLDQTSLVNYIFEIALSGDYPLFDYFTGDEITPRDIRKLEKENKDLRLNIGKIQFTEMWYSNDNSTNLNKEVVAIVPGMEIIGLDGEVRGYKPVFKLQLK